MEIFESKLMIKCFVCSICFSLITKIGCFVTFDTVSGHFKYRIVHKSEDFFDAELYCNTDFEGNLVKISSKADQTFLVRQIERTGINSK